MWLQATYSVLSSGETETKVGIQASCTTPPSAPPCVIGICGIIPTPVRCRRVIASVCRSSSRISSEFMQLTYTRVPA